MKLRIHQSGKDVLDVEIDGDAYRRRFEQRFRLAVVFGIGEVDPAGHAGRGHRRKQQRPPARRLPGHRGDDER